MADTEVAGAAPLAPARARSAERSAAAQLLARSGIVGIGLTVLIIGALHVVSPTAEISPVHRTISEYGLSTLAWAFNLGVLLLAAGSLAVFAAQALLDRLRAGAGVFGALWIAGLVTVVAFPKHNWAVGPSASGQVHRMASLVAFVALPVALLLITRGRRSTTDRIIRWLGVASLAWFVPILIAIGTQGSGGTPWWQAIPLGLIERGMALTELTALLMLAGSALQAARAAR